MLLRCVPLVVALVAILGSGFTVGSVEAASPPAAKAGDQTVKCKTIKSSKQRDDCIGQARTKRTHERAAPSKTAAAKPKSVKAAGPIGRTSTPSVAAAPPAAAPGSPAPPMPAPVEISTR